MSSSTEAVTAAVEERPPEVAHHFYSIEQQTESATLGMWLFLAQEIMFFGGLFICYIVYRTTFGASDVYPEIFAHASQTLSVPIGTFNTLVLLLSSFTMALGVYFSQIGDKKKLLLMLVTTLLLGFVFVGVKLAFEWAPKWEHGLIPGTHFGPHLFEGISANELVHYQYLMDHMPQAQMFFFLYFIMTGMHAFHMLIGFGLLVWLMILVSTGRIHKNKYIKIELFGFYWHFVDIVWVFLFPFFYLVR